MDRSVQITFNKEYIMEIRDAVGFAFEALKKKEMHVDEIANHIKISLSDFMEEDFESIKRKVTSFLNRDSKKGANASYTQVKNRKTNRPRRGIYYQKKKKLPPPPPPPPPPDKETRNLYFGKAGEFAVVSELLFRGYNASIMSVDEGIDITASKEDKFFFIQVKSTKFEKGALSVGIQKSRFVNNSNANIFYVIAYRQQVKDKDTRRNIYANMYLVLPDYELDRLISVGVISKSEGNLQVKAKIHEGRLFLYNKQKLEDAFYYMDNFDLLK